MKKQFAFIISIGVLFQSTQLSAVSPQVEALERAITSAHTRAFSKDNLITERLMPEDSAKWNEAVKAVGDYIATHAPSLKETFAQLNAINITLINTLQSTFGAYIAPHLIASKKQTGGSLKPDIFEKIKAINFDKAYANLNTIKNDENRTQKIQKDLKESTASKIKSLLKSSSENEKISESKNLLSRLALTLELTIAKAFKDFDKLKALAQK